MRIQDAMATIPYLRLMYNKEWFEGLKDEQAVGVIIHELLHIILLHPYRKGNRKRNLWAVACDMAVNEQIDKKLLLSDAITVEKIAEEIKETLVPLKSAEYYYDIISKGEEGISFLESNEQLRITLKSGQELRAKYREKIKGHIGGRGEYKTFNTIFFFDIDLNSDDDKVIYTTV